MISEDMDVYPEKVHCTDQRRSGRQFISTSISSASEEESLIELTASSLDSSDFSLSDDDCELNDSEQTTSSMPEPKYQSESSEFSSGTLISEHWSLESSTSCEINHVGISCSYQDSDVNCSCEEADVSSSSQDSDDESFQNAVVHGSHHDSDDHCSSQEADVSSSCEDSEVGSSYENSEVVNLCQGTTMSYPAEDSGEGSLLEGCFYFEPTKSDSGESRPSSDEPSSSGSFFKLQSNNSDGESSLMDSMSDLEEEEESSSWSPRLEVEESVLEVTRNDSKSSMHLQKTSTTVVGSTKKTDKEKSDITVKNISSIHQKQEIKREDITYNWCLNNFHIKCYELVSSSFEEDESDFFEELAFRDTFAFTSSSKPKAIDKPKRPPMRKAVVQDDYVPGERQSKVSFAPPETLVTVRYFERTTEELEDDLIFKAIKSDLDHFKMRIIRFKEQMSSFLTAEHRSFIMLRNELDVYY